MECYAAGVEVFGMSAIPFLTRCCVVGGGPAGMMLGYLLARAGIDVTILEKHRDFFRDFRGDTVHPSTLELLYELNLLDDFLKLPHSKITSAGITFGEESFEAANFNGARTHCHFTAIMPQWDFLRFLSEQGKKYRGFYLRMEHEAVDLVYERERVQGVTVRTPEGTEQILADLVVACDGRHSVLREAAQLPLTELGVPIDVLWFQISRLEGDRTEVLGQVNFGKVLVLINRGDYFQAGLVVEKNSFDEIKQRGLEAFRQDIARIAPFLSDRVEELQSWDQVKLLSVQINRLNRWYCPGLLCIGDAAHAMSPVFGIGINLAIQDALAAANVLTEPLREGRNPDSVLYRVQKKRELRTRLTQRLQMLAHSGLQVVFRNSGPLTPPWQFKLAMRAHLMQPVMLYVVGVGVLPESPAVAARPKRQTAGRIRRLAALGAGIAAAAAVAWFRFTCYRSERSTA
jgi:2-polyprenyl-6-methoxyphenol hydroxylase-like FAD-dependent oxidoreductase